MAFIPPAQQGFRDRLAGVFSGAGSIFGNLQNSPGSTPDEVERQRQRAEMLNALAMGAGGQASSFAGALAQGLQGFAGGRLNKRSDIQQQAGLAGADAALASNPVLAALTGQDVRAPQGVQPMPNTMMAPLDAGGVPDVSIPQQPDAGVDPGIAGAFSGSAPAIGADPGIANYFSAIKSAESGGDPNAKNPLSSATGLYQFTAGTWREMQRKHPELGLTDNGRTDPAQQERAIRAFTADNAQVLQGAGIPVNGGSLYAAHFLGAGGATKVLTQPDSTPMRAVVGPGVVEANPFLADMTVGGFKQWSASKGGGSGAPLAGGPATPSAAPSNVVAALIQASGDPWVQLKYGPVLDALMQQEMGRQDAAYSQQLEQSDPMYRAQLQQQQLQNQALMNPTSEPVFQGGQWWDTSSGQPVPLTEAQAEQTAAQQNFEFMISQGMDPQTAMDRAFSGGTTVNVGDGSPGLGKLSTDFGYVLDPATGQPLIDPATGLPTAAPVPGSPAARELEQAAQMVEGQQELAGRAGAVVMEDIDRALEQSEAFGTTGLIGGMTSDIGGTPSRDLAATLSTIRSNIGFDRLQQMREASPTGGALGAVSERELSELQAVLGNLEQNQSKEQLQRNLRRLRDIYSGIMEKANAYPNASQYGFGGGEASVGGIPEGIDAATWEFMTPEEKALWQ